MRVITNILKGIGILLYLIFGIVLGYVWEFFSTTILWIVKLPRRFTCRKHGHEWVCHGTGLMGILGPLYPFTCEKCGKRSRGDMKDFDNQPFTAKLKI
ncbi:hypothetical protein SIM22_05860 [Bacillus cereus group sp. BfR-BA-01363]|uniref:hypothetical protein n=1 Tax=Bacillus cereus group sp. BfR-BA-01363 TaxID=3094882 RepID=UPI0029C4388C|nr:hypothetical protein [Bacillus cereus group sp. BfR-BA-01363]MDX5853628.1 hypothetical protein [Bacillus cereus group sp. BfR-BA-01363]